MAFRPGKSHSLFLSRSSFTTQNLVRELANAPSEYESTKYQKKKKEKEEENSNEMVRIKMKGMYTPKCVKCVIPFGLILETYEKIPANRNRNDVSFVWFIHALSIQHQDDTNVLL